MTVNNVLKLCKYLKSLLFIQGQDAELVHDIEYNAKMGISMHNMARHIERFAFYLKRRHSHDISSDAIEDLYKIADIAYSRGTIPDDIRYVDDYRNGMLPHRQFGKSKFLRQMRANFDCSALPGDFSAALNAQGRTIIDWSNPTTNKENTMRNKKKVEIQVTVPKYKLGQKVNLMVKGRLGGLEVDTLAEGYVSDIRLCVDECGDHTVQYIVTQYNEQGCHMNCSDWVYDDRIKKIA